MWTTPRLRTRPKKPLSTNTEGIPTVSNSRKSARPCSSIEDHTWSGFCRRWSSFSRSSSSRRLISNTRTKSLTCWIQKSSQDPTPPTTTNSPAFHTASTVNTQSLGKIIRLVSSAMSKICHWLAETWKKWSLWITWRKTSAGKRKRNSDKGVQRWPGRWRATQARRYSHAYCEFRNRGC